MSAPASIPFRQMPANFGPLKSANATAQILGPCGDTMQFWLRVDGDLVEQATFTTDGCGASIVSGAAAAGQKVGLLDIDIHGPSIPRLMGLEGAEPGGESGAIQPVSAGPNLSVMSMGFLLRSPRDAVIWRGLLKAGLIRQFLSGIAWGDLDALVVHSPPGTGDEPLSIAQMLGPGTGAVLVTTPQAVAVADVRRSVTFCQKLQLQVLGIIENMSGLECPHCGKTTDLFGAGGGEALAREMEVPFLGALPLDPEVVVSGDGGTPFVRRSAQGRAAQAMSRIIEPILTQIKTNGRVSASSPS